MLTQKMERRTIETFKKHADIGLEGFCPTTRMHQRSHQVLVDRGFKGLVLCDDGFDERAERVRRVETVKQSVRSEL